MKEKQEGKEEKPRLHRRSTALWRRQDTCKTRRARRHNHLMTTKQELPDEALSTMAIEWRRKALEGDLHARGIAHELETELRRRAEAPFTNYDTLDLRPLESRTVRRRWWSFWRAP